MSSVKDEAIKLIQALPEDCTMDDIQYHLYVRDKIDRGIAAADAGRVVPHEEVRVAIRSEFRAGSSLC
jgi:predicted transcriptional regulator